MFGYINANLKDLTEEQKNTYHAYYCGLCRKLKEVAGAKGQMLLNYDMTFLIILLTGLYEPEEDRKSFTCGLHPTKKRMSCVNEFTEYAAKMNILLSYQNFQDDWQDDRSLLKKSFVHIFQKEYNQIKNEYPRQTAAIERYMVKLSVAESGNETNLDAVAGLTGDMLAEIFAYRQDEWTEELKCLGFYMGKFIYLMDAYEDMEEDTRKGLYNPFVAQMREQQSSQDLNTYVKLILMSMMSECAKSFERLPILTDAGILRNILYSGVWTRFEICQAKKNKKSIKQEDNKNEKSI